MAPFGGPTTGGWALALDSRLVMPVEVEGTRRLPERLGSVLDRALGVGPRDDGLEGGLGPEERPTG